MKYLFFVTILISSCTSMMTSLTGHSYKYSISMIKPKQDTLLSYMDDKANFTFNFSQEEIDFTMKNISDQPLKIIWDEASLVQYGKVEKIMHKGVKYIDRNSSMPATTVPPGATLDDLVVPTSNISYNSSTYSSGWNTSDFFPKTDYNSEKVRKTILDLKGQEVTLYLPIRDTKGNELGYSFVFRIDDVNCINCNTQTQTKAKAKTKR